MALVKVYRGFSSHPGEAPWISPRDPKIPGSGIDLSRPLGIHWSADPGVSFQFSQNRTVTDDPQPKYGLTMGNYSSSWEPVKNPEPSGVVLEGYTHHENIIKRGTPEWRQVAERYGVIDTAKHGDLEAEHTIRPGSTIHVVRQHFIGPQFGGLEVREHPLGTTATA